MAGDQTKFQTAMAHAERFAEQGDWEKAGQAYRFALAEFPNNEAAIIGFGAATLHLGSPEQAWRAFQQALKVNPNSTEALSYMGDIQAQMGKPDAAAQTHVRVGSMLASQGNVEAAMEAWLKAIEFAPNTPDAHQNLAQALAHQGESRLAARQFLALAGVYQQQGNSTQAAQAIEAAQNVLPDDPGLETARQALQQGTAIEADMVSETEPEPEPEADFDVLTDAEPAQDDGLDFMLPADDEPDNDVESDFSSMLLLPDEPEEEESIGLSSLLMPDEPAAEPEPEPEMTADDDPLGGFFDGDDEASSAEEEKPAEEEWDIFGSDETSMVAAHGLIQEAQERALAELANIIFEDDQGGPETSVLPDGTQVSRMEINMMVIQAIDLQARNDIEDAVDRYRQVVQANAGRPALYYNLGLLYKNREEHKEAIKLFRMTMPDPDYRLSAMLALGQLYYDTGETDQALRQFAELLKSIDLETIADEQFDDLSDAYDSLADQYLAADETAKTDSFVTAVTQFFAKPDWQQKAEEARQQMDSISEGSVMSLAEYLESPETEVIITALAATNDYVHQEHYLSASEECLRAIQRAPYYLPLHLRLADILIKQDLTDTAIQKYLAVAEVYEIRSQVEQAVGVFKKVLKFAPMDVTVRSKLIDVQLSRRKLEPALDNYINLADSYYQLAQVDKALEKYDEALKLAADSPNENSWKAKILTQTGDIYSQRFDWAKATAYLEEAYKLDPQNERTSRQLVELHYKQGKTSQAIRILDTLLKEYYQTKETGKAISFLKELVAVNPDDMFLRQRLAISYRQGGQRQEAIAEYDTLAEIQFTNGMKDHALQTLQTILKLKPENPEGYQQVIEQIKSGSM